MLFNLNIGTYPLRLDLLPYDFDEVNKYNELLKHKRNLFSTLIYTKKKLRKTLFKFKLIL